MQVQILRSLVDPRKTTSTEEGHPKVFPHVTVGGHCVFIHDSTVGAECNLLPLVAIIGDGYPVDALMFVECEKQVLSVMLELHIWENNCDERPRSLLLDQRLQARHLLKEASFGVYRQPSLGTGEVLRPAICQEAIGLEVVYPVLTYDGRYSHLIRCSPQGENGRGVNVPLGGLLVTL